MFLIFFTFAPLVSGYSFDLSIRLLIIYIPALYFIINYSSLDLFKKLKLFLVT